MSPALEWSKLSYTLNLKGRPPKVVLDNLSGSLSDGDFLAVLGPSGSGKTSLLNALAGRVRSMSQSELQGQVLLQGKPLLSSSSKRLISYIQQEDCLFARLTVFETLLLSAKFHLPVTSSNELIMGKVEAVIQELGLSACKHTLVGSATVRGVSGGERKRVSVGKELMSSPKYILVDEPTSGLDAFQAQSTIDMLRALSDTGRIVVAVLHQPRSAIYVQFDKLLLLAGGRTVYFGAASQARGYFRRLGYDCPEHFNTADYLLDVISIDTRTNEICQVTTQRVAYLTSSWSETGESMRVIFGKREGTKTATEHFATISLKSPVIGELTSPQPLTCIDQTRGWLRDFCLLLWRACAENVRNYGAFLIRFAMSAFTVVILSLVYQRLPHTQRSIQDRIGVLFFVTINQAFGPLIAIVAAIPTEKRIVLSERLSSSYSVTAYFLGRFLAELPALILLVVVFSCILYWSSNLSAEVDRFFVFMALVFLDSLASLALGLFISSFSPNVNVSNAIGPAVLLIFIIFGGFYINSQSLPLGSAWVKNLSPMYWTFQGLAINEFRGARFSCPTKALQIGGCEATGEQVLMRLGFADANIPTCVMGLCLLTVGFLILGYVSLLVNVDRFLPIQVVDKALHNGDQGEADEEERKDPDERVVVTMYH